jgi:hypothetical protein
MQDLRTLGIASIISLTLGACASYEQKHVEYGALQLYANSVTMNDITLAADPYDTEAKVIEAFDENLLEKGYYPIKVLVENGSDNRIMIFRESVELQDANGYSYRPVSASVMADDFEDNKIAYALLGFGIFSYMSADDANKERTADYEAKNLGDSQIIPAGRSRGAFVYFQLPQGANVNASRLFLDVEHLENNETTRLELPLDRTYSGTQQSGEKWIFEIMEGQSPSSADRQVILIVDNRFKVKVSTNGWRGNISGEIDHLGNLAGTGTLKRMGYTPRTFEFSASQSNGAFHTSVVINAQSGSVTTITIELARQQL